MPLQTYMLCTCLWIIYRMPSFSYEIIFIIKFCEIKMYNSKIVLPSAFSLILLFSLPFTHNQLVFSCFLTLSQVNVPHSPFGKSCEIVYHPLAATHSTIRKSHTINLSEFSYLGFSISFKVILGECSFICWEWR